MPTKAVPIRTRHFLPEKWIVSLVDANGTRYELGSVDISSSSSIAVPASVPDGTYNIEVVTRGLAWKEVIQKPLGSLTMDSTASMPGIVGLPLLTGLAYEIFEGWLRLRWNGDVPPDLTGLVSAGIWIGYGIPEFDQTPSVIIPLFSSNSEHFYIVQLTDGPHPEFLIAYWDDVYWPEDYWPEGYWPEHAPSLIACAGIAAFSPNGDQGPGQYIALPDRSVKIPAALINEG